MAMKKYLQFFVVILLLPIYLIGLALMMVTGAIGSYVMTGKWWTK